MSRFEQRLVQVTPPDGAEFELPCVWVPRSGGKVLAIWRTGSAPEQSLIVSEGEAYVIAAILPVNEVTERATLEPVRR